MAGAPTHCSQTAYSRFFTASIDLDSTEALVRGASAISMHAFDDSTHLPVRQRLDALADRVRLRVRSTSRAALLAHLHQVLFAEERLRGPASASATALHCYLPQVLQLGQGIPEITSLIYKAVAERLHVAVAGVAFHGRLCVCVESESGRLFVDPHRGGRIYSVADAGRLERPGAAVGDGRCETGPFHNGPVTNGPLNNGPVTNGPLNNGPVTNRLWLRRILSELQRLFAAQDRLADFHAMIELQELLGQ